MFYHSTATLVFPLIIALARKIHICTGTAAECLFRLGTLLCAAVAEPSAAVMFRVMSQSPNSRVINKYPAHLSRYLSQELLSALHSLVVCLEVTGILFTRFLRLPVRDGTWFIIT